MAINGLPSEKELYPSPTAGRGRVLAEGICQIFTNPGNTWFTRFSIGRVTMSRPRHVPLLLALLLVVAPIGAPVSSAVAAQSAAISVKVNMARILRINAPAATVIIGNPGVADVTIQDPQTLVLTGKSYGQTNLIVLDDMGNPIADSIIEVIQAQADLMTVYQGSARTTFVCSPTCQPTIMLGDDPNYSSNNFASSNLIGAMSQ